MSEAAQTRRSDRKTARETKKADIQSAEKIAEQENATLTKVEKDKIDLKKIISCTCNYKKVRKRNSHHT